MLPIPVLWAYIPGPIKKLALYAGIIVLALWAAKVYWLNPHDNKIEDQARGKVTEEIRKSAEARWKPQIEALQTANNALSAKVVVIEAEKADLIKTREILTGALNKSISANKAKQEVNIASIKDIPSSKLIGAVRALSNELAGTAQPGPTH